MTFLWRTVVDSPFITATWVDVLDIAVLSFLFYRGLLFLRGTRALQSLLGLSVLGMTYMLSDWLGLDTLHWLLNNLFVWVALALIILFQEDIRRALARAGATFFGRTARTTDANVQEDLIRACFALAHRKIGALIAIERTAELDSYMEGSHKLDAQVSTELVSAIFHPTSPIHDGAMIVSGDRIRAAGVFLPISLQKNTRRTFGTRHRAAVGLTDATDAMCLVVSEERGTVSLIQNAEVTPVADANDLRQRLQEGMKSVRPIAILLNGGEGE
jgi:diadenylate cyclase